MLNDVVYDFPRDDLLPHLPRDLGTVIDVGCGGGALGRALKQRQPDVAVYGIEPDSRAAAAARTSAYEHVVAGYFPQALGELGDRSYDSVLFMDVLEHLPDPHEALRAAVPVLSPGGKVYASIPNARHVTVWWPLVRRGEWTYTDTGLMDRTHLRWFTRSSIEGMFAESGLRIVSLTGINRSRRGAEGSDGWKLSLLSKVTGGRTDSFFWVQWFVVAEPG